MIIVSAHNAQQVGSSLTLECTINEFVNGSNTLEIVWTDSIATLKRTNVTSTGTRSLLPVYMDSYTITQLSTSDQGREIQCIANKIDPPVMDSGVIILNVTGKQFCKILLITMSMKATNTLNMYVCDTVTTITMVQLTSKMSVMLHALIKF